MVELTEEGRALVEALLAAPVAWRSPGELASATGRDIEETTDLVATMDAGGWLAAWERPDELVVTLSVAAASRLGVRLVESGPAETPRWARRSEPEPPAPRSLGVFRDGRAAALELVADSRPGPGSEPEEARSRPEGPPRKGPEAEMLPRPTILVGTGLSPWPGPGDGRKASCPACRSRRLGPSMYCLCCDRWGLDHLLREGPPPRKAPRPAPEADAGVLERARRARKAKRRAHLAARAEAERRRARRRPARP